MATLLAAAEMAWAAPAVLEPEHVSRHVAFFNAMEDEPVVNAVPNSAAAAWLQDNIPLFESPDAEFEEIYYFRWWALRKHLRKAPDGSPALAKWDGYVFTEFINRAQPVSSALGHHLMEGRWLRDSKYHDSYVHYWLRSDGGKSILLKHGYSNYSSWLQFALYHRFLVNGDQSFVVSLLDDLVADFREWEKARGTGGSPAESASTSKNMGETPMPPLAPGLFWQFDVRDAMEESISGARTKRNVRPPLNSYMYGNARALVEIARLAGRDDIARQFTARAEQLRALAQEALWDPGLKFYVAQLEEGGRAQVREEIGYIPWYFHLPEKERGYEIAWAQLLDPQGFRAPWGITTAERRHPEFRSHGIGTCEWDGALWPFATSQTLTALANVLRDYPQDVISKHDYFDALVTYARSHHHDAKPYLGEYQDEVTGQWLKGNHPRSRWYNHSTFADLVISGLVGLRPRADETIEVHPLVPEGAWPWFCLDNVRYHGRDVTILWDRDGTRYGRGRGLVVLVDGQEVARSERLERVTGQIPQATR